MACSCEPLSRVGSASWPRRWARRREACPRGRVGGVGGGDRSPREEINSQCRCATVPCQLSREGTLRDSHDQSARVRFQEPPKDWYSLGTDVTTVLRVGRYGFFFFSNEGFEPPHVHVQDGSSLAKFWLAPVELAASTGFASQELTRLRILALNIGRIGGGLA